MKINLRALGLGLALVLLNASTAKADCVMPAGVEGEMVYNTSYKVMQFCDGSDWVQMSGRTVYVAGGSPPTDCPNIGDVCTDGSVYAGLWGVDPIYVTRCDAGMTWDGSSCTGGRATIPWNNGNASNYVTTGVTDPSNGAANTAILIATDSDSGTGGTQPHQAAQFCADLIAHGQGDWYLPAKNELNIMYGNKAAIGGFGTNGYWMALERSQEKAFSQSFANGDVYWDGYPKDTTYAVRCARR